MKDGAVGDAIRIPRRGVRHDDRASACQQRALSAGRVDLARRESRILRLRLSREVRERVNACLMLKRQQQQAKNNREGAA
jgi:hypothetical protein